MSSENLAPVEAPPPDARPFTQSNVKELRAELHQLSQTKLNTYVVLDQTQLEAGILLESALRLHAQVVFDSVKEFPLTAAAIKPELDAHFAGIDSAYHKLMRLVDTEPTDYVKVLELAKRIATAWKTLGELVKAPTLQHKLESLAKPLELTSLSFERTKRWLTVLNETRYKSILSEEEQGKPKEIFELLDLGLELVEEGTTDQDKEANERLAQVNLRLDEVKWIVVRNQVPYNLGREVVGIHDALNALVSRLRFNQARHERGDPMNARKEQHEKHSQFAIGRRMAVRYDLDRRALRAEVVWGARGSAMA